MNVWLTAQVPAHLCVQFWLWSRRSLQGCWHPESISQQLSHPGATLGCWLLQFGIREMRTHGCVSWVCLHLRIKLLTVSCLSLRYRPAFHVSLFSPASLSNFQLLSSLWVTRRYLCVHLTFPRVLSSFANLPLQITHGNLCDDTWWFIQSKALCILPLPVCCSLREG